MGIHKVTKVTLNCTLIHNLSTAIREQQQQWILVPSSSQWLFQVWWLLSVDSLPELREMPWKCKNRPSAPFIVVCWSFGVLLFYFFSFRVHQAGGGGGGWRSRWQVGVCFSVITSAHSELPVSGEAAPWSSNHELKVPPGFLMPQPRVRTQAKLYIKCIQTHFRKFTIKILYSLRKCSQCWAN